MAGVTGVGLPWRAGNADYTGRIDDEARWVKPWLHGVRRADRQIGPCLRVQAELQTAHVSMGLAVYLLRIFALGCPGPRRKSLLANSPGKQTLGRCFPF